MCAFCYYANSHTPLERTVGDNLAKFSVGSLEESKEEVEVVEDERPASDAEDD